MALKWLGFNVVYHEHDSPTVPPSAPSTFAKSIAWSRRKLARKADLCVLPNEGRAEHFRQSTGRSKPVATVWNCPAAEEAAASVARSDTRNLKLYYHGNLSPRLLPLTLIDAVAKARCSIHLTAIGYKTVGNEDYDEALLARAANLGVKDRLTVLPPLSRSDLLALARHFDVGWAALPTDPHDVNFRHMVGASNKAFDYLACGLALLVSDDGEWKSTFVDQGYGLCCNLNDAGSIATALAWFHEHPSETREMGERGRQRIIEDWNYENQFTPLFKSIEDARA